MLQQDEPDDFVIATGVQCSVRQFIEKTATALGMGLRWEGDGFKEIGYWINSSLQEGKSDSAIRVTQPVIRIDSFYFRPTEVETLLGDPTMAREKLGWVQEITLDQIVHEMVETDLAEAKKHALLKQHGFNVNITVE